MGVAPADFVVFLGFTEIVTDVPKRFLYLIMITPEAPDPPLISVPPPLFQPAPPPPEPELAKGGGGVANPAVPVSPFGLEIPPQSPPAPGVPPVFIPPPPPVAKHKPSIGSNFPLPPFPAVLPVPIPPALPAPPPPPAGHPPTSLPFPPLFPNPFPP